MVKKYRILVDDVGKRFCRGEIGLALENDFSEKYFAKLHLGTTQYYQESDDKIHIVDRTFYFYEEEVKEVGESKIRVGKSLADAITDSIDIFGFGTEYHSLGHTFVVKMPVNILSFTDKNDLEKLGWKKSGDYWVYDRISNE